MSIASNIIINITSYIELVIVIKDTLISYFSTRVTIYKRSVNLINND